MENPDNFAGENIININNDYEVQYWTSQLKVTNDELKEAIDEVGNGIEAVKVYLNRG